MEKLFTTQNKFYCPLCNRSIVRSEYLTVTFGDTKEGWLANMVTHYRHDHIASWDRCWGYEGRRYRAGWFGNYDEEKQKVNERAKRQLIRKAKTYLLHHQIQPEDFLKLEKTDSQTFALAKKMLADT